MLWIMLNAGLRFSAEEHIRQLGERHCIRLRWTKAWATSEADIVNRRAFIPQVHSALDYLTALHEIGHIVEPIRPAGLVRESAAWAWAIETARPSILERMTKTDWRRLGCCWVSHVGNPW